MNLNTARLGMVIVDLQNDFLAPDGAYARLGASEPHHNRLEACLDFRDLYPLLDAFTLLQQCGCLSLAEKQQLEEWLDAFLAWLAEDSAAFLSSHSNSPACSWYHLLMHQVRRDCLYFLP